MDRHDPLHRQLAGPGALRALALFLFLAAAGTARALPTPPGGGVPKPTGTPGSLTVVSWAGFKGAVSFTFDDSQPSQVAHFAELNATGVKSTFYACSGTAGSSSGFDSTWRSAAAAGHEIGNHTAHHCHANLTGCSFGTPAGSTLAEVDQDTSYIGSHFGASVGTMASPFGDAGWSAAASQRFFLMRGVGGGMVAPNDGTNPFNLPSYLASTNESSSSFNNQTSTARSQGKWVIFLFHTLTPTSANWFNPVPIGNVTASMNFARSLGDVWTDTVTSIGAYWRAGKVLSAVTPTTSGTSKTWTWTLPANFPRGRTLRVKVTGGTVKQGSTVLTWDTHGYYEISLDAGSLTASP